jgi:hypothetical protein
MVCLFSFTLRFNFIFNIVSNFKKRGLGSTAGAEQNGSCIPQKIFILTVKTTGTQIIGSNTLKKLNSKAPFIGFFLIRKSTFF